jgi:hypothetical protein
MKKIIGAVCRWSSASAAVLVLALGACSDVTTPDARVAAPKGRAQRDLLPDIQPTVAAGIHYTCVLRYSGVINCFGAPADPQSPAVVQVTGDVFVNLAVSNSSVSGCGVLRSGPIKCWGDNYNGEAPATVAPNNEWFAQVAVSETHGCGVRTDGVVQCWGLNEHGEAEPYLASGVKVAVGTHSTCVLRSDGVINCYGDNTYDQAPEEITAAVGVFTDISMSYDFGCGVRTDGKIQCWGADDAGQAPAEISHSAGTFVSVSTGDSHACGVGNDLTVDCWGDNSDGQAPSNVVSAVSSFLQVSAGANHTCAMRPSGFVECWGESIPSYTHVLSDGRSVKATAQSASRVALTFDPTPGMTLQQIQRRAKTATSWTPWVSLADTTGDAGGFLDALAVPATTYQYRVRACNGSCAAYVVSNSVVAKSFSAPSSTPSAHAEAVERTTVVLYWLDVDDETSYLIERREKNGATWSGWRLLATKPAGSAGLGDENLELGKRYQYRVTACNTAGCSPAASSNQVIAELPPEAVPHFSAYLAAADQIVLNWDEGPQAYTYQIERRMWDYNNRVWGTTGTPLGASWPATDLTDDASSGVEANRAYRYRIRGCNIIRCGPWSLWVSVNNGALPLEPSPLQGTPAGAPVAFPGAGFIAFGWTDTNADEIGYAVERRYDGGGGWSPWEFQTLTAADAISYQDFTPPSGLVQYRVKACNTVGCSPYKTTRQVAY